MTAPGPGNPFRKGPTGTLIDVRVIPRSPGNAAGGLRDGRLVVRVTAPPVDHAANDAVVRVLADALDLPKTAVRVVAGHTARNKVVEVPGVPESFLRKRLNVAP
jgi:uncharacterized protein YggU (UPF0235/DUF167 family)